MFVILVVCDNLGLGGYLWQPRRLSELSCTNSSDARDYDDAPVSVQDSRIEPLIVLGDSEWLKFV